MRTRNLILFIGLITSITIFSPLTTLGQACSGLWVNNHPLTFQCISGQQIGLPAMGDPFPCPVNPVYTSLQTNTFNFDNPINDFFIDFNAFDAVSPGCPRMQIKINGIFFPLTVANLIELPSGTICTGSVSFLTISSDGYITTFVANSIGQGRLVFSGVNASNITISTNDLGGGIVVANPCLAPLPLEIKSISGKAIGNCEVKLEFQSGLESNVRYIEIEGSLEGAIFLKLLELLPQGSDSRYGVLVKSSGINFYRLKINDIDGNFKFSKIIQVNSNCNKPLYSIMPNPSNGIISISGLSGKESILIYDISGRKILSYKEAFSNKIDVRKLSPGLYVVQILQDKIISAQLKVIKN
ncbi:MAG: T9SS type A sorting domain-containing protein [Ferruginibacter sp.]|nr:T9SS type A sorting domain-containing protein [Ferruginibacter sp.]